METAITLMISFGDNVVVFHNDAAYHWVRINMSRSVAGELYSAPHVGYRIIFTHVH